MLLNDGTFKGQNILSPDAIGSMSTVQNPAWASSYGPTGLGLFQCTAFGDREVWGHYGGGGYGWAGNVHFCPEENSGVVVLTNSEQYLEELVEYLFDFALLITPDIPDQIMSETTELKLYPNPAFNRIHIQCTQEIEELCLYSLAGQEIKTVRGMTSVDVSSLAPGIYILEVRTEAGVVRQKFVKQ